MKKLPFLLITLLLLGSCVEDEPNTDVDLSSEEAIAALDEASAQIIDDVLDLMDSDGLYMMEEATEYLDYFMDYDVTQRSDAKNRLQELYHFFVKAPASRVRTDDPNNEEIPSGLFEWDPVNEEFVHDPEYDGTDLILLFPVGDSESNNGKFKLVEWDETDTGLPKSIELYVYADDNLMVELDLDINWSSFDFPEDGEVYLFMKPFTLVAQYNLTDGLETTLNVTLAKGDDQIVSIGLSADGQSIFNDKLPEVAGHIEYRWVKLEGSADLEGYEKALNEGEDPNDHIDIDLLIENEVAGSIVLLMETDDDGFSDYYPYIEFLDGELYSLEDYMEDILASLEEELNSHSL